MKGKNSQRKGARFDRNWVKIPEIWSNTSEKGEIFQSCNKKENTCSSFLAPNSISFFEARSLYHTTFDCFYKCKDLWKLFKKGLFNLFLYETSHGKMYFVDLKFFHRIKMKYVILVSLFIEIEADFLVNQLLKGEGLDYDRMVLHFHLFFFKCCLISVRVVSMIHNIHEDQECAILAEFIPSNSLNIFKCLFRRLKICLQLNLNQFLNR